MRHLDSFPSFLWNKYSLSTCYVPGTYVLEIKWWTRTNMASGLWNLYSNVVFPDFSSWVNRQVQTGGYHVLLWTRHSRGVGEGTQEEKSIRWLVQTYRIPTFHYSTILFYLWWSQVFLVWVCVGCSVLFCFWVSSGNLFSVSAGFKWGA